MNRSVSRAPRPQSHTLGTLKVPDWRIGEWVHPWHVVSSWETPRNFSWKFCEDLSSFGRDIAVCYPIKQNWQTDRHLTDATQIFTRLFKSDFVTLKININERQASGNQDNITFHCEISFIIIAFYRPNNTVQICNRLLMNKVSNLLVISSIYLQLIKLISIKSWMN